MIPKNVVEIGFGAFDRFIDYIEFADTEGWNIYTSYDNKYEPVDVSDKYENVDIIQANTIVKRSEG